jgi:glycosyltransferase involved in cell wall biosynthesis
LPLLQKTILQVVPELNSGGAERSTLEMVEAIVGAGGRALVATSGGRLEAEIAAVGGAVFRIPVHSKNPATIWANAGRLARLIEDAQVDLVHVRSRAPAWSALWAARRTGKPLVSTYHGAYSARGPAKRLYNSAMVRADRVIANSAYTAKAVRAEYSLDPGRLRVIPRGADLDVFDPVKVEPGRLAGLDAWGARDGALRLLLPARLTFWKGQDIAVRAADLIKKRRLAATGEAPLLRLIFAGDAQGAGDFAGRLRRETRDRGVEDMVGLVGHCADMPAAYAWADAVLSPATLPEAFGRVAAEAGAMRKPVIASDLGGQRETVIDGVTGFLTPPGDVAALADAIEAVERMSVAGRAAMGARARRHIEANFSANRMREATLAVYAELLG